MANEEQLSILKQGVEVWNKWRENDHEVEIDLTNADLYGANLADANLSYFYSGDVPFYAIFRVPDLSGSNMKNSNLYRANLRDTNLERANLMNANLAMANLRHAYLRGANLNGANLSGAILWETYLPQSSLRQATLEAANLNWANLDGVDLSQAKCMRAGFFRAELINVNLRGANLSGVNFSEADLRGSHLNNTNLLGCHFTSTKLEGVKFSKALIGNTVFAGINLSDTIGLEAVKHQGPSHISADTFSLSKGKIPDIFLRGCGLSDWEIEEVKLYIPDLSNSEVNEILYKIYELRASQALQISPLFISYSHSDTEFVNKMEGFFNQRGIRFWRDIHDMKAGRMEKQIDQAIRQNPTVLLILSEHSIKSDWVEHEVRTARDLEKKVGRDVLCPVALDDGWKTSLWPKRVMEQVMEYNILDFSAWKDDSKFASMFRKLIDGLKLFYKG